MATQVITPGGEIKTAWASGSIAAKSLSPGIGHSPVDRRWDGVSMDKTLGAYSILACQKAMDDAGVTPDQIDGVICCDSHIAGASGGSASQMGAAALLRPALRLRAGGSRW